VKSFQKNWAQSQCGNLLQTHKEMIGSRIAPHSTKMKHYHLLPVLLTFNSLKTNCSYDTVMYKHRKNEYGYVHCR
jgi:hypothetical protein